MMVQQLSHNEGRQVTFRISFTGPGQAMSAGPPPAPPGTVQSLASGKCLDLPGGQTRDGTPAIQFDCHGGPNQQWHVDYAGDAGYRIVSRMSGKCIGMAPDATAGGQIVQSQCRGAPDQLWALKRAGNELAFQNVANQLCLDLPGASLDNGVNLIAWACNGGINQTWRYRSATVP
jgi:cytochrome c